MDVISYYFCPKEVSHSVKILDKAMYKVFSDDIYCYFHCHHLIWYIQ